MVDRVPGSVGGWLSDRLNPVPVFITCLTIVAVLASLAAFEPPLLILGTVIFHGMASALGAASEACFALVALVTPTERLDTTTGVVGAAGGIGGFIPPLVMGTVYGEFGDYSFGFVLLAFATAAAAAYTAVAPVVSSAQQRREGGGRRGEQRRDPPADRRAPGRIGQEELGHGGARQRGTDGERRRTHAHRTTGHEGGHGQ
jgi:MFS transporter, NNP family, nitrate/nitrite transporter